MVSEMKKQKVQKTRQKPVIGLLPRETKPASEQTTIETDDVYDSLSREQQMEEDELAPREAGFMQGYESPKQTEREIKKNLRKKKE